MNIVNITDKDELKAIKHLYNSTSRDDARPSLMCINVGEETSEASDGFMMNTIKTPECLQEYTGKLINFVKRPVSGVNQVTIEDKKNFPKTDEITNGHETNARFGVNATLLVKLLKDLPKDTFIVFDIDTEAKPLKINTFERADLG